MKKIYVLVALVMLIYGACMPLICIKTDASADNGIGSSAPRTEQNTVLRSNKVRVLDKESGKVTKMKVDDYIFGVVAAEMPASYCDEALKAQAVASYTYMLFRSAQRADMDYDVCADSSKDQAYISREKACEKWGDNADKYCEKLDKAIGLGIQPDNETESALTVWGTDYSYLQPVDSVGDLTASKYLSEVKFTADELVKKLELPDSDASKIKWVSGIKTSESGTVTHISICGKEFTGAKIRSLLKLRSAVFTVRYDDGNFIFRVQGHGHGVGMSQYGANYLARQNYTYVEILSWYYTGCMMKQL